jgi:hypothetical protein
MQTLVLILLLCAAALAWGSAVVGGRDSRDGRDWRTGPGLGDRPSRVGD